MKKILLGSTFLLSAMVANVSWADCWIIPKSQCPHAELSSKSHPGVDMHEAQLLEGDLSKSDFSKANLKGANIYHGKLMGGNFTETDLSDATLYNADLTGANFTGAKLVGAKLKGANLSEANLTDADLSNAEIENAKFVKTTFCRTTMPNGIVNSGPNCPSEKAPRIPKVSIDVSTIEDAHVTCNDKASCDKAFSLTQIYINTMASQKIQVATDTIIETYNPSEYGNVGMGAVKIPGKGSSATIRLSVTCKTSEGGHFDDFCAAKEMEIYKGFRPFVSKMLSE